MKARKVYEAIEFERGRDPRDIMSIGDVERRKARKLSDEDLMDMTIDKNLTDDDTILVMDILKERYPEKSKKEIKEEVKEWKIIKSTHPATHNSRKKLIRRWVGNDSFDKLEKFKDIFKKYGVEIDLDHSFGEIHGMSPSKISPKMLKYLHETIPNRFYFCPYDAHGLIKYADVEDIEPLMDYILQNWDNFKDIRARADDPEDWLGKMLSGILDNWHSKDLKSLFDKYIKKANRKMYLDGKEIRWNKNHWFNQNINRLKYRKYLHR